MPRITDETMEDQKIGGSNFTFSRTKMEHLKAMEYTVAFLGIDVTGSLVGYEEKIQKLLKMILRSFDKNPRIDNMLLLTYLFAKRRDMPTGIDDIHGMRPVPDINESFYDSDIVCEGSTNLYDAAYYGLEAVRKTGDDLFDRHCDVNGIGIMVTDGWNNNSTMGPDTVKEAIAKLTKSEKFESFRPILVGINTTATTGLTGYLEKFQKEAGFDQYVDIEDFSDEALAALADWISESISTTSEALNSGGPSQAIDYAI